MGSVEALSKNFGRPIEFMGKTYYTFPKAEEILKANDSELMSCGVGYRCNYVQSVAKMVVTGEIDLDKIEKMSTEEARIELMRILGVGQKVADCVLLYSYERTEVFPTDVWIKRVVEFLFLKREAKMAEIQSFAKKSFGEFGGFAQQYLFYYARKSKVFVDFK